MKKILIIQTAFLGDVILTLPVIESLRVSFPEAVIDMVVLPGAKNIVETNPAVKKCIIFDKRNQHKGLKGLKELARILTEGGYDLCITPHRSWRSAYLSYRTKAPRRIGFDRSAWKGAFSDIVAYVNDAHEIQRNLSLLAPLGIDHVIWRPSIYTTEEDQEQVKRHLQQTDRKIIAMAPGSIWPTKRWPQHYYHIIAERLVEGNYAVVLIGGDEDSDLCMQLAENNKWVLSLAGELTLRQTYYLLTVCTALITNDSAPLHLGTAAGVTVFAIFGATVPGFGFAPVGSQDRVFEQEHLLCRPCGIHGHQKCPMHTFACMEELTPAIVWPEIKKTLMQNIGA
jgi:heptosyltransferase-2